MIDLEEMHRMLDCESVRIMFDQNKSLKGNPICVDYSDETASGENEISIEQKDGRIISVKESEIFGWETID